MIQDTPDSVQIDAIWKIPTKEAQPIAILGILRVFEFLDSGTFMKYVKNLSTV